MSILDALNPAQRRAAEAAGGPLLILAGPLLILAGAGSGKTRRVLTHRIAFLIKEVGVPPWRILAATFTNKAAGEMRERIEQLVGSEANELWIGTFHSICARILRRQAESFGLDPNFSIYDEDDRRATIRRVLDAHQIDERDLAPRAVVSQISRAKNAMLDPLEFAHQANEHQQKIAELYADYERELRRNQALDFDDLLIEVVRQFERHSDILQTYQERFEHLLVDEYQDTNRPQYLLCRQLAAHHRNICVVGDDDQSIYQFRGADIRNILDFERDYPDAHIVRLEQNYRSTGRILAAANAVIGHNQGRKGKELWTNGPEGDPVADRRMRLGPPRGPPRRRCPSGATTAWAATGLETLRCSTAPTPSRGPLKRSYSAPRLPYVIIGGIRFYDRREIRDVLSYLRLLVNPADDIALRRIINTPRRGIGDTSPRPLAGFCPNQGLEPFHCTGAPRRRTPTSAAAQKKALLPSPI